MEMQKENKLKLKDLITHYAEFRDAPALYKIIDKNPTEVLQAVLKF
jgi:threonine dehydrogenase-like Zn-dependent dehydrogenase